MTSTERRKRGRPARADKREPLTKARIAEVGLAIAGDEGFPNLTMRRVAAELGVTVRALYNVVADRQEVVDLVAAQMLDALPVHDFGRDDWRETVRQMYHDARAVYRTFPRATLISLDETVTPTEVPVKRMLAPEQELAFLVGLGLTLDEALAVRGAFLVEVFGFVMLLDYRYDRADDTTREMLGQPVPLAWLDTKPEVDAPLARAAAERRYTPDDLFEQLVDRAVGAIERKLEGK
ncbi:TetR/AcrR family transcriptional regulator [Gordonia crocea]|uniref:HTH tetR-type domain-containing protein n=1 Tax=Gordonia crocea TaxID=589162 RepID=A0A7I9V093_9ACTN|nr:TetR/AcrR family transcriptional regulator [Gordonia crocea]GED98490.1 hypothetical protein nbrc107697_25290 [Gordonia crocea]